MSCSNSDFFFLLFFYSKLWKSNLKKKIKKKKSSGLLNLPLRLFVVERTGGTAQILWHGKV